LLFLRKFYGMYKEDDLENMKKYSWNSWLGFVSPRVLYTVSWFLGTKLTKNKYTREYIQAIVNDGKPIIQFVSHWYTNDLVHRNRIKAIFFQHYVVIYGYDADWYWCYDPAKHRCDSLTNVHIPYTMMEKSVKWSGLGVFNSWMSYWYDKKKS
jgi:hypothetical protein